MSAIPVPIIEDCPVCLIPCDEEIHDATLRIRAWFREQIQPRAIKVVKPKTHATATERQRTIGRVQPRKCGQRDHLIPEVLRLRGERLEWKQISIRLGISPDSVRRLHRRGLDVARKAGNVCH